MFSHQQVITLDMDLPSLLAMLLSKPPSMDLQNVLSTIMIVHTSLFLTKELTSQQMECDDCYRSEPGPNTQ